MNISEHHEHSEIPTGYGKLTRVGVILFALVLIIGLCAFFYFGQRARHKKSENLQEEVERAADAPIAVDVVHVKAALATSTLPLPGEARAFYDTTIFARTSGYISKWFVDIGDQVKENQTLAKIETPELDDQLAAAKAKLNELNSEVNVAQTEVDFARVSFNRWNNLAPGRAVSKQERDEKEAAFHSSEAKLKAAQAQVDLGQAEVNRLVTLSSFKDVKAPFAGVITQRHIDIGALVTAGSTSSTTPLYSIAQSDRIRVFVDVPQVAIPTVHVGMTVNANCREYPGRTFVGKVDRTASAIDQVTKTLRTEVLVENKDLTVLPGMYLMVDFESTRQHPPLQVPAGALCFRPTGPQVAVVTPRGIVQMRDIKITRDLGEFVEIDGEGLDANSTVALNVGSDIATGDRVEAHDTDKPSTASGGPPSTQPTAEADATRH